MITPWPLLSACRAPHRMSERAAGAQQGSAGTGGAASSREASQPAKGAEGTGSGGPSPLGRYIAELTSIRATLLKASEEHQAVQKQLQDVRVFARISRCCPLTKMRAYTASEVSMECSRENVTLHL